LHKSYFFAGVHRGVRQKAAGQYDSLSAEAGYNYFFVKAILCHF
jgi:hypothetical protein